MNICQKCSHENETDALFCVSCGMSLKEQNAESAILSKRSYNVHDKKDSSNKSAIKIDIKNGVGIFSGPISESQQRVGCLVFIIISVVVTLIAFGITNKNASAIWHYIPAALCTIITFLLIYIFVVEKRRTPNKPIRKIIVNGVWLSNDKVYPGKQEVELQEECFVDEIYERESTNLINAELLQTENEMAIDTTKASIILQIINSKYDKKDFRIAKIHVSKDSNTIHTYNLISSNPVIIVNGVIYPCKMLKLVNQLKKIADGLKPIQRDKTSICNLAFTLRSGSTGGLLFYGAIGGLIKGVADSIKTSSAKKALQGGDFIDKETSAFLLERMEQYGWQINFRSLGINELGLANSEW